MLDLWHQLNQLTASYNLIQTALGASLSRVSVLIRVAWKDDCCLVFCEPYSGIHLEGTTQTTAFSAENSLLRHSHWRKHHLCQQDSICPKHRCTASHLSWKKCKPPSLPTRTRSLLLETITIVNGFDSLLTAHLHPVSHWRNYHLCQWFWFSTESTFANDLISMHTASHWRNYRLLSTA